MGQKLNHNSLFSVSQLQYGTTPEEPSIWQLACEMGAASLCPLTRHGREIGLELRCFSTTEVLLGVARGKILQSQSKCLGSYSTISQLDQQFVNQDLGFMRENLCGLWSKAFAQPPVSVLISVFLKTSWGSGTVIFYYYFFFSFRNRMKNLCTATCKEQHLKALARN